MEGTDGKDVNEFLDSGRLVLTLCKSDARGSYHHIMIPLPKSYEDAVNEAGQLFQPYIGHQFQASDIVLKCAIKRANGTGAWGIIRPTDWKSVIRPDGDEVGVFLRQDSLDLPYEPKIESKTAGNQKINLEVQQPQRNNPTSSTSGTQLEGKIMNLTLKNGDMIVGNEKSTMIKVPVTYQACQAAAYNAFKDDLDYNKKQNDVILQIKSGEKRYGLAASWSVVTPEAYSVLLSTGGDRINVWVSGPSRWEKWSGWSSSLVSQA